MKPSILVGGQAVIEGVMMRVPGAYSTAVRDSKGKIHLNRELFTSLTENSNFWKRPVFRGIASLFEAMKIGMSTLQWSADIAMPPKENEKESNRISDFITTLFSICLAIFLFMIAPMWITTAFLDVEEEVVWFNLISGGFRIIFFVIYLFLISLLDDIKRLFQYHGAEHRVIYNFESGMDVTIDNAQSFPTQHPRCGTSFLFIVLISAIFVFAVVDTIIMSVLGTISLSIRLLSHLPMIPLVSGIGYEVIKLIAIKDSLVFRLLRNPGLWLQNITTRPPDNEMIEVSITALKDAFGDKYEEMVGKEYIAEAIG